MCRSPGKPKRALLSLATGAGKTFIAVNLLKRISDAGQLTRALFVCDRDELRTQALKAFQNVFGVRRRRGLPQAGRHEQRQERPHPHRHLPDPGRRERGRRRQLPDHLLPRELLHPHRHRRVPPLGLGQVVAGAHAQPRRRADRPDRHARASSDVQARQTARGQAGRRDHRQQHRLLRRAGLRVRHGPGHRGRLPGRLRDPEGPRQPGRHRHHHGRDHGPPSRGCHHRPAAHAASRSRSSTTTTPVRRPHPAARPRAGHVPGPVRLPAGDRRPGAEDHHLLRPRPPRRRRGRLHEQPLRRVVRRPTASSGWTTTPSNAPPPAAATTSSPTCAPPRAATSSPPRWTC